MTNNMVTLALVGDISAGGCSEGFSHFCRVLRGLSTEVGAPYLGLIMTREPVPAGTFSVVVDGAPDKVAALIDGFGDVAAALAAGMRPAHTAEVADAGADLAAITDPRVYPLRLITPKGEWIVAQSASLDWPESEEQPFPETPKMVADVTTSFDILRGVVCGFNEHDGLVMHVYDSLFDTRVDCLLPRGDHETALRCWGHTVEIAGLVRRHTPGGRPISITHIRHTPEIVAGPAVGGRTIASRSRRRGTPESNWQAEEKKATR